MKGVGALDRRILALAVPAALSSFLHVIHRGVDMYWVGALGTDALASITVSTITVWMFASLGTLVATGLTALVARYVGAGRWHAARYVGHQGVLWAAVLGLVAGVLGYFVTPLVFTTANATDAVAGPGIAYTRIFWGGGVFVLVQQAGDAVFRGRGNTLIPFLIALAALALNVVLDPILIHGWGPIPGHGVPGAAWATLIATAFDAVLVIATLARRGWLGRTQPDDDELRFDASTPVGRPVLLGALDGSVLRRVARVGTPLAVSGLAFTIIYFVVLRIATDVGGSAAQAALGIGHTGEGVAYVICMGWAAAASALVGQNLGAGRPDEAARAAWRAVAQCGVLCLAWSLVLYFHAEGVAAWFLRPDADVDTRVYAVRYFRIVAICLVPQAVTVVLDGAFGGAGLTVPAMVISMVFAAARVPLGWLLAIHLAWGVDGVWWAITVTTVLSGIVTGAWFLRGTWKTRTV